jgi:hypothetical protein
MSDVSRGSTKQAWAVGGTIFAATMLILLGIWQVFEGIAALAKDNIIIRGVNYTYEFNLTAWGWIHIVLGALAIIVGFFLFTGATWARVLGIGFAVLSAIAQFAWIPYYPIWALTIIALDVFVVWALAIIRPRESEMW